MPTLAEVSTLQMGLAPRIAVAGSLADRIPWIIDSESMNDQDVASIRRDHPEEYIELRMETLQRVESVCASLWEDRRIVHRLLDDVPSGTFPRAKGVFVACPHCWRKHGETEPIRVGQFL
jgi:hypothetical protein